MLNNLQLSQRRFLNYENTLLFYTCKIQIFLKNSFSLTFLILAKSHIPNNRDFYL